MKKLLLVGLSVFLLTGCLWGDEATSYTRLTKNFWLNWWEDSTDQHILLSFDNNRNGGTPIIEQTVYAVGYNDNFIIAKQHPDKEKEIEARLFKPDSTTGDYLLESPADTIWLSGEDSVYKKNGKWYHISNGWNPPDSLKPYKSITYFHIIDIRNYERKNRDRYKVYTYDNEKEYMKKRHEIGVPDNLTFTIKSPTLE